MTRITNNKAELLKNFWNVYRRTGGMKIKRSICQVILEFIKKRVGRVTYPLISEGRFQQG